MSTFELPERPVTQSGSFGPPRFGTPVFQLGGGDGPRVSPYAAHVIGAFVASIEGEEGGVIASDLRSSFRQVVEETIPAVLADIVERYDVMQRSDFQGLITAPDIFHWIGDTGGEVVAFGCPFPKRG